MSDRVRINIRITLYASVIRSRAGIINAGDTVFSLQKTVFENGDSQKFLFLNHQASDKERSVYA